MSAAGRKKDPIWVSFQRVKKGKGYRAVCKTCNKEIQGVLERMKKHLTVCSVNPTQGNYLIQLVISSYWLVETEH